MLNIRRILGIWTMKHLARLFPAQGCITARQGTCVESQEQCENQARVKVRFVTSTRKPSSAVTQTGVIVGFTGSEFSQTRLFVGLRDIGENRSPACAYAHTKNQISQGLHVFAKQRWEPFRKHTKESFFKSHGHFY